MKEIFITKIISNEHSLLGKFEIDLDENNKKHLIIMGKNGSGKSTLLKELKAHLSAILLDISTDRVQMYKELCNSHNKTLIDIKGGTYKEGNVVYVIAQTNNYNKGEAKKQAYN